MNKSNLLVILLTIVLLASCSSVDDNLRAMIPDDAVGVVKIDMPALLSKSEMMKGEAETVVVPDDLKKLIDEADPNIISDVVLNLPNSGIDFKNNCYVFFSPGIYKAIALFPISDEDAAETMIAKIASGKMTEKSGVLFASHLDYGYAIDDGVLLIGRFMNPVADDVASNAAKGILDKSKPSLFEKEEVSKAIDVKDCDITAYIDAKGLTSILKDHSRFSTIFGNIPALEIITGSGIKAMTATINFETSKKDGDSVKILTDFVYDKSSLYSKLYDQVVASATGGEGVETLNALPGELDTYFAIKVNGAKFVEIPQTALLFDWLASSSFTSGVKCKEIISTLNGALAFGVQDNGGDYNFGVAAQSTSPDMVVAEIVDVANRRGQSPEKNANGEYVYEYNFGEKAIVMSKTDGVVYLRCVNFAPSYSAGIWPAFVDIMKKSAMVVYKKMIVGNSHEGHLCWGLRDKSHGEGIYYAENEKENVVISVLKFLCWKEPNSNFEEDVEEDYYY
ncbi:MAG: DUF4836 family protein [Muribaculaceae bacterium]|nr:DUF4836 family protein [Muribaculaceae bacterium]